MKNPSASKFYHGYFAHVLPLMYQTISNQRDAHTFLFLEAPSLGRQPRTST